MEKKSEVHVAEETLDPEDWDGLRALGHRMVDDMLDYLQTVRQRPAWQPIPPEVKDFLSEPLPIEPQGAERAYQDFVENILPYPGGNINPRYWGWVKGTGTPLGALAEMLAATMNSNLGGSDHAANEVEKQVINWLKQIMGYPGGASGLLVSGGSMANLVGLAVARNKMAGYDIREYGVAAAPRRMVVYASEETHSSVQKAVELLGLGRDGLRFIPVNERFEIEIAALKDAVAEDRTAGRQPICIVGNAGTVNTAAMDDLNALADLCQKENLWLHVDGAFGALAVLAPESKHLVRGIERADSIAFDLHKWMYMPVEIGCTLVRSEEDHRQTFSLRPEYLAHMERGAAGGSRWFTDYGIQLTRGFRALKAWMSLKEHGTLKYGRLIQQNIDQAGYLAELIEVAPELELMAPVTLNIVCFRYVAKGLAGEALDTLNREIMFELHEQGIAVPSYTTLNGAFALRCAITNHRSRREDFDLLVREVIRIGDKLAG